jgi:hypothetical protein
MTTNDGRQQRASEYRELANEIFAEARMEADPVLRNRLIDAANACLRVSERLETLPAFAH